MRISFYICSKLDTMQVQRKIRSIKDDLMSSLSSRLNLYHIDAPIFLKKGTGLQDDLSGRECSVSFGDYEIPHSLAKWKRLMCHEMKLQRGEGIITDMRAIRQNETLDDLHSYYVDQFDWEKVISKDDRTIEYLQSEVIKIWSSILEVAEKYGIHLHKEIKFISARDYDVVVDEYVLCKEYKVVFLMHLDYQYGRSPDYDDWTLNGDLLVYDSLHDRVIELSSMGIRVDSYSLEYQMLLLYKGYSQYHHDIKHYPYTIGGGIGQSRIIMFLLGIKSISDVQPLH